ncbi:hypothetical protein GmHk_13G036156 [Glycine max]|nr:hypothetical protein GmHk_13G036156 [Glycine max]
MIGHRLAKCKVTSIVKQDNRTTTSEGPTTVSPSVQSQDAEQPQATNNIPALQTPFDIFGVENSKSSLHQDSTEDPSDGFVRTNGRVWSKLDRAFCNQLWFNSFENSSCEVVGFESIFDHAPLVVTTEVLVPKGNSPFKFNNAIVDHPNFLSIVSDGWSHQVSGCCMFKVCKRLKTLKSPMKLLFKQEFSHIANRVEQAEAEYNRLLNSLQHNPFDSSLLMQVNRTRDLVLIKKIIHTGDIITIKEGNVEVAKQTLNSWSSNEQLLVGKAYDYIRGAKPTVNWNSNVWNPAIPPKMSFILWLAIKNCLLTLDRAAFLNKGLLCPLCRTEAESHAHLFFS